MDLAQPVDQIVIEPRQVRRFEIGVDSLRPERVEQGLHHVVGHRTEEIRDRFGHVEARITARGERMQDKSLDELDAEWRAVKAGEAR